MPDDKSPDYEKAARLVALADRAFPNLDPLKRAADLSEPSTAAALVPARVIETAKLAELVTFDDDDAPTTTPVAPAPVEPVDWLGELERMAADAPVAVAPDNILSIPSAPAPGHDYFAGLDVQLTEADRQSAESRAWSFGILGGALAFGAIGSGVVAGRIEREQVAAAEHNALLTAIEAESDAQRAQAAQVQERVEETRDDLLRSTQIAAESTIAAQRGDVALLDSVNLDRRDRQIEREEQLAAEAEAPEPAPRRRRRKAQASRDPQVLPEPRSPVADAIGKVLAQK